MEYEKSNKDYFCTSCQVSHNARMPYCLNICVSTSQLHGFHQPREQGVVCPPDTTHVDWLTIPGATISDLLLAWRLDYHREPRPMQVLLVGGLNDLLKGGDFGSVRDQIRRFEFNVNYQNKYHPGLKNEFSVATLLNPPKMVWFEDNGPTPPNHIDRQDEIVLINDWLDVFNRQNGRQCVPRFNTLGTGTDRVFKTHRWNEWRQSEPRDGMLHLSNKNRVKMGKQLVKFFVGEQERFG